MADNVAITAGAGTTVATDDVSGVHYQRVKLVWGVDGTVNDANATTPLPVSLAVLISGEDTTNNRLRVEVKPVDADSVLEVLQNAVTATGNGTAANLKGYPAMTVEVSGTFVGTVTFEGTIDDASWFTVALPTTQQGAPVTSATAAGSFYLPSGVTLSQFRGRVSAYTSGSITVKSRKYPR